MLEKYILQINLFLSKLKGDKYIKFPKNIT